MRALRAVATSLIVIEACCMCAAIVFGERFSGSTGAPWLPAALIVIAHVGGLLVLSGRRLPGGAVSRAILAATLIGVAVRFYLPTIQVGLPPFRAMTMRRQEATLVVALRELAAAQEQYRIAAGRYATIVSQLSLVRPLPAGVAFFLRANSDSGWAAIATGNGATCRLWVRDLRLRHEAVQPEGAPYCGGNRTGENNQAVGTVLASRPVPATPFESSALVGEWRQHRMDARRTGISAAFDTSTGFTWTIRIGGELRSSATVVGGQVFVGAHGNGEIVALHLDSGREGWRARASNWIHHEPAVDSSLIVVGFGNNEEWMWNPLAVRSKTHPRAMGSDPNGVVAYDRRTGLERWRVYTPGPVMLTPALWRDVGVVQALDSLVVGFSLNDGRRLWSVAVPGSAPMGNPLLLGDTVVVALDPGQLCRLLASNGRVFACTSLPESHGYAGHASPAAHGGTIVATGFDFPFPPRSGPKSLAKLIAGLSASAVPLEVTHVPVAFGVNASTGDLRWASRIESERYTAPLGHSAGTPVIDGNTAYVTFPTVGRIVALGLADGTVRWSAPVAPARGSVSVVGGAVLSATSGAGWVVLDAATGKVRCRTELPGRADRASLSIAAGTGILTHRNGLVLARPLARWLSCQI